MSESAKLESAPEISIVIAVNQHENDLGLVIEGFKSQTFPAESFEVIFVEDGVRKAMDWRSLTAEHAHRSGKTLVVEHVRSEAGGRAALNNLGISKARAPVIALLADDFIPSPTFVEAHAAVHRENPDERVVGIGPGRFSKSLTDDRFRKWLENNELLFGVDISQDKLPKQFFYAGNASAKKSFLQSSGLFDEDYPYDAWDDYDLGVRMAALGMTSRFVAGAVAVHDHAVTLRERCSSMRKAGESACIFDRKYSGVHSWQRKMKLDAWEYEFMALISFARFVFCRKEKDLFAFYRNKVDAAFVAGYNKARAVYGKARAGLQ